MEFSSSHGFDVENDKHGHKTNRDHDNVSELKRNNYMENKTSYRKFKKKSNRKRNKRNKTIPHQSLVSTIHQDQTVQSKFLVRSKSFKYCVVHTYLLLLL